MLQRVKQHTALLKEPAEQLSMAVLAARMTDSVVILDTDGRVRFCNAAFALLLNRPAQEVSHRWVGDLMDTASRVEFGARWQARRRGNTDPYTVIWLRGDGSSVRTRVLPLPLFTAAGVFDGSLGIAIDTTEQARLSEELQLANFIVAQTTVVLYRSRLEDDFPIEYISGNVSHWGYSPQDFVSGAVTFNKVVHEADYRRVLENARSHVVRGHRDFVQHYRVWTTRGDLLCVEDHVYVRNAPNGSGIYLEGVISDITERRRAQRALHHVLTQTIGAIAATIDRRDPYTAGHQRRVADLARAIAQHLALDEAVTEGVYLGALVHDVGKIAIPVDILARPGRLSPEEFSLVKTHVQAGVDVLKDVAFPWPIAAMVAQHHERLDGSGYPGGLAGDAIQLEARIIAVADVFESMSTHRPYRAALAVDTALGELARGRGKLFDPKVVDACLTLVTASNNNTAALWSALEAARPDGESQESVSVTTHDLARD